MADTVVLHGDERWESPYVFSTFVALREKGLSFEFRTMSLHAGEHRRGTYPVLSMTGRVPALQHDDSWLAESSAIDEYLEDVFPAPRWPSIYPASTRQRARSRQIQAWLRTDLAAIRDERDVATVFGAPSATPLTSAARDEVQRLVGVCLRLLPTGERFLFGEFSIADADSRSCCSGWSGTETLCPTGCWCTPTGSGIGRPSASGWTTLGQSRRSRRGARSWRRRIRTAGSHHESSAVSTSSGRSSQRRGGGERRADPRAPS